MAPSRRRACPAHTSPASCHRNARLWCVLCWWHYGLILRLQDAAIAAEVGDYFDRDKERVAVGVRGVSIAGVGALDALQRLDRRIEALRAA
eukprot:SAG11_NODE_2439_length_3363_cov_1.689951_4_plen_91_part_00